ncbi:hypothetical protein BDV19DRAFT_365471 [Aspergillus venezuelensis]
MSKRDSIFLHPHLERLTITSGTMKDFCCFDESLRHSTVLKEPTLRSCDLSPETLRKVLAVPRALQRLTCSSNPKAYVPWEIRQRQPYLDAIIQEQAHSLQALDCMFIPLSEHLEIPMAPFDFTPLTALQELTTTLELVVGQ